MSMDWGKSPWHLCHVTPCHDLYYMGGVAVGSTDISSKTLAVVFPPSPLFDLPPLAFFIFGGKSTPFRKEQSKKQE
jgi:hypothetical protein